jgi:pyruvate/2-oxoglutarate dehydrogenase complex dihydrolipoamide acyltransferase (E2) component
MNHTDGTIFPFPKMRRAAVEFMREAQRQHSVHALIEVDVTKPRQCLRAYKARTGESLSFTAFIITCLAKAVDGNKSVQAYRKGRHQLIVFDEVDVITMIEREVGGRKMPADHIIRAANTKTFREVHNEIRAAQVEKVEKFKWLERLASWPTFITGFVWWALRHDPYLRKRFGGTVGVTSVGMFGIGAGWGITIPYGPLSLVLGGIAEKPGVVDGRIEIREYLCLTISFDHDIIDGAPAARFTQQLKKMIESGFGLDEIGAVPYEEQTSHWEVQHV